MKDDTTQVHLHYFLNSVHLAFLQISCIRRRCLGSSCLPGITIGNIQNASTLLNGDGITILQDQWLIGRLSAKPLWHVVRAEVAGEDVFDVVVINGPAHLCLCACVDQGEMTFHAARGLSAGGGGIGRVTWFVVVVVWSGKDSGMNAMNIIGQGTCVHPSREMYQYNLLMEVDIISSEDPQPHTYQCPHSLAPTPQGRRPAPKPSTDIHAPYTSSSQSMQQWLAPVPRTLRQCAAIQPSG